MPPDVGIERNEFDMSIDDPDGDGIQCEITEGDLDVTEWYMLNAPRPAMGETSPLTHWGRRLFREFGCAECHVQEWYIEPADLDNPDIHARYLGDLRFFDLDVKFNRLRGRLEGKLDKLSTEAIFA